MHCFARGISSFSLPFFLFTCLQAQQPEAPKPPATPPAASGQAQPPAAGSTDSQPVTTGNVLKSRHWVRLISAGATLSVLGQPPLLNGGYSRTETNFILDSSTTAGGHRLGYGGLVQIRLPRKYAAAGSFLIHRSFHKTNIDSYAGIDNPNTPLDDRVHTTINEESNVRYWDYGIFFRRYSKDHTASGHRWFVEGGPSFRRVYNISTTRQTTVGATDTSDTAPIKPDRKISRGLTGGIGAQFVDDFGVKLVPEFRFTRWAQPNFTERGITSRKNQFEAIVSITF